MQALARGLGVTKILPQYLRSLESLMPEVRPAESLPELVPAQGTKRMRVGLLLGCVQDAFFSHVNAATARVLAAEGCEVVAPQPQPCCGALMIHAGVERQALALARQLIDTFERANVDAVVVNAAGCGSNVKDYGYLLRDDPQYRERAVNFSRRCRDVSEVLAELEPRAERKPMSLRVAYHDACHLQHAQGVSAAPRKLLKQIPGLELLELPEAAICCGSAGVYNLAQPAAAQDLGDRKAQNVLSTSPDVVATGNPGCILQIRAALHRSGSPVRVVHTVELLDAAIRGTNL
jgi:glycolate oxidase iron-sulfur subunit